MIKSFTHNRNRVNWREQSGITLLLSVLILSGIFIVVTTVSILAVQEIRASRSSSLSEPAIVAAETSGEQGIWLLKRSTFSTSCPASSATQIDGTTSTSSTTRTTKCVTYDKASFDVQPGTPVSFFLYDPADINGNLCMNADVPVGAPTCDGGKLFGNIVLRMMSGAFSANVDAVTLDGTYFNSFGLTLVPNGTLTIPIPDPIPGSADERIVVTITATSPITVEATTSGGVITGLPDYPTIDAEGCSSTTAITNCNSTNEIFKRRVNITVPR